MSKSGGVMPLIIAMAAFLAFAATAPAQVPGLTPTLEPRKSFVGTSEDVVVKVTYRNDSAEDLYLVRWQTPLQGVEANLFDVRVDGRPVAYTGRLYKRATPAAADYLRIPAGGAVAADVDLSSVYDLSRTGEYSIRYRVALQDALRAGTRAKISDISGLRGLESNTIFLGVERDRRAVDAVEKLARTADAARAPRPPKPLKPRYVSCSSSRKSQLVTALSNAQKMALKSRDYLNALPAEARPTDDVYTTWFGAYDPASYSSVTDDYVNLYSTYSTKTFVFHCDCKENHYAYVYADQPYQVYLCNFFWKAPALGTDSKAGTLVHEASHFTVVAGTDDYAYGQAACRDLAIENPGEAIHNADTHEYFAEPLVPGPG
jgi:peptidyl-Lys metalloendopeptidase